MDPLSVASSSISVLSTTRAVLDLLTKSALHVKSAELIETLDDGALELDIHLTEFNSMVGRSDLSLDANIAAKCVSLCHKRIKRVEKLQSRVVASSRRGKIAKTLMVPEVSYTEFAQAVDRFGQAVTMYKDMEMRSHVEMLLNDTQSRKKTTSRSDDDGTGRSEMAGLSGSDSPTAATVHVPPGLVSAKQCGEYPDSLHSQHQLQQERARGEDFTFAATIIQPHETSDSHHAVRGLLDSGSQDNWISAEAIRRIGLVEEMKETQEGSRYRSFSGHSFIPKGSIELTWFAENAAVSRRTTFLVGDGNSPFDMILGKGFILEESIFVFDRAVLANEFRHNFSEEDRRIIEQNARQKEASEDQLSVLRRVDEQARRDERRRQKALARSSLGTSSAYTSTLSLISGIHSLPLTATATPNSQAIQQAMANSTSTDPDPGQPAAPNLD